MCVFVYVYVYVYKQAGKQSTRETFSAIAKRLKEKLYANEMIKFPQSRTLQ